MKEFSLTQIAEQNKNDFFTPNHSYNTFSYEDAINTFVDIAQKQGHNLTEFENVCLKGIIDILKVEDGFRFSNLPAEENVYNRIIPYKLYFLVIVSIFIGGITGGVLFFHWFFSVFGAIIFTIFVLFIYDYSQKRIEKDFTTHADIQCDKVKLQLINICKSIDLIVDTYQRRIDENTSRISQERIIPFERKYEWLLSQIQAIIGYERYNEDEPDFKNELKERCEDLALVMTNIQISFEDYNGDNEGLFEIIEYPDISYPKRVLPSVLSKDELIIKGKVFVPENN